MNKFFFFLFIASLTASSYSCNSKNLPKPRGYFRIFFPEKNYTVFNCAECPFTFEYPVYSEIISDTSTSAEHCFYNMYFKNFNATFHLSYKDVKNNIDELIDDSRGLTYKHAIKADAIETTKINDSISNVYGIIYDIKGNAASSVQMYITNYSNHFMRGALYFNTSPNKDSLAPVIAFLRDDILHFINTFEWK